MEKEVQVNRRQVAVVSFVLVFAASALARESGGPLFCASGPAHPGARAVGPASSALYFSTLNGGLDVPSWDAEDDPSNFTAVIDLGAPGQSLNGIGYNVHIKNTSAGSYGGSWLSEAAVFFSASDGNGVYLTPGYDDDFNSLSWVDYSSPVVDLESLGYDFVLPDGKLYLQFFEGYDDAANQVDAYWRADSAFTVTYTPEPASLLLVGLGLILARRR
jgi:hypothetical protein